MKNEGLCVRPSANSSSVPRQQRRYGGDDAEQVEEGVLQQPLHGPVGVGGGVAGGTGGVVAQSHGEEQGYAEGDGQPVHPGLHRKETRRNIDNPYVHSFILMRHYLQTTL